MNAPLHSRSLRPRSCQKCGGDAFFDAGEALEWRCLQCGKSLLISSAQAEELAEPVGMRMARWEGPGAATTGELKTRRSSIRRRLMRPDR
jgi:hypothetical protein